MGGSCRGVPRRPPSPRIIGCQDPLNGRPEGAPEALDESLEDALNSTAIHGACCEICKHGADELHLMFIRRAKMPAAAEPLDGAPEGAPEALEEGPMDPLNSTAIYCVFCEIGKKWCRRITSMFIRLANKPAATLLDPLKEPLEPLK